MEGRGSYKQRNREPGIQVMRGVNLITQFCFAMEIQGWARLILDHRDERITKVLNHILDESEIKIERRM